MVWWQAAARSLSGIESGSAGRIGRARRHVAVRGTGHDADETVPSAIVISVKIASDNASGLRVA